MERRAGFRGWFWQPPRAHGEIIEDRAVSFLELFYDLVYVVVIARAAHTLAEDITWLAFGEFVVIFGMIWLAWLNGTLYYDLHGREDGRTRFFVFAQMLLLALLAVFTADAAGEGGQGFAIVYVSFLAVLTWLWYTVRRQDSEEFMAVTARYLTAMGISIIVVGVSAFLPAETRMMVWAAFVAGWMIVMVVLGRAPELESGVRATDSLVERFGLFVIIVLGEVVVGAVTGLSETDHNLRSIATGLLGLIVGFAFWWTYFDFVGRRLPVESSVLRNLWMMSHLPVALAIAGAGAAMVSLTEHYADAHAPTATAWLLTGSMAIGLLALVVTMTTLQDWAKLPSLYRPVAAALAGAALASLLVGWFRPSPWLLALSLFAILTAVWGFAVSRYVRTPDTRGSVPEPPSS